MQLKQYWTSSNCSDTLVTSATAVGRITSRKTTVYYQREIVNNAALVHAIQSLSLKAI